MSALQATPVHPDPVDGGGVGGNAASSPGSAYSWVSSVDGVSTATGNKLTEIPTVSWVARGGLTVDLTLYHNSEISFGSASRGAKWSLIYDTGLSSDASGNVHMGWGNGNRYDFGNTNGSYSPPPGIHDRLIANGSPIASYDLIKKDQTKWHFAPYGSPGNFLLTSISDENGNVITINRAANGGSLGITDPTGRGVTFGYNSTYYTSITDPLGRVFSFGFDSRGNMSQVTYPLLNGTSYSLNLGYDSSHNITGIQDLRGNYALLSYNAADNSLAWEQDNLGNRTTFTYGYDGVRNISNALATTVTDANSHSTAYWYDSTGRLSTTYDALGNHDAYTFDAANNQTQKLDRRGYYWYYTYDGMGNILTTKDPYINTKTLTYNSHNKTLTAKTQLGRNVAITYDAYDNPTQMQEKDAGGNVLATTTYSYGLGYGLVSSKTDANNHNTYYGYDGNGYLNSVTTPEGHQTQGTYDALGFQTIRTDAMSRTTNYTQDAWERLVTTTYPDSTTHTFTYDPNGNLTGFADPVTGPWFRAYDADNRLLLEGDFTTTLVSHAYDAAGQKGLLSTTTDYWGRVISYAYTARNQLSSVAEPTGTESYAYDPDGNQTNCYTPNGLHTDQFYNNDGTLARYNNYNSAGSIVAAFDYYYNSDGQLAVKDEGTSTDPSQNGSQTLYGYDGQGHLTSEARNSVNPYSRAYTYDGAGNRVAMTLDGTTFGPIYYGVDDELDGNGSLIYYYYDADGQPLYTISGGGARTDYTFDFDGQLTSLSKPGSTTTFQYDALGRQLRRTVNGAGTVYYYDGSHILYETTVGGTLLTASYTWGNGLIRRNGEYPLSDGRGSERLETDGSQNVTATALTDASGMTVSSSGSSGSAYGFQGASGYRSDGDGSVGITSLQKVGARYYDPLFGRFITRDTALGQKPYAYCDGDPVNFSDPSGHSRLSDALKKLLQNIASLSGTVKGALTGGLSALGAGFGLSKLLDTYNKQHISNQGLANESTMLQNFEKTHPDVDMTRQWELYQYMQKGTLGADAGFAAEAGKQYLNGMGGAR